jgi:hypothetical protein
MSRRKITRDEINKRAITCMALSMEFKCPERFKKHLTQISRMVTISELMPSKRRLALCGQ